MVSDRSEEIRVLVLKQREDKFRKYIKRKKEKADSKCSGSGSSWNHAYAQAVDDLEIKFKRIFSGKEDKPVILP